MAVIKLVESPNGVPVFDKTSGLRFEVGKAVEVAEEHVKRLLADVHFKFVKHDGASAPVAPAVVAEPAPVVPAFVAPVVEPVPVAEVPETAVPVGERVQ